MNEGQKAEASTPELKTVHVPEPFRPLFLKAQKYVQEYFQDWEHEPEKSTLKISGERYLLVRGSSMSVDFFRMVENLYKDQGKEEVIVQVLTHGKIGSYADSVLRQVVCWSDAGEHQDLRRANRPGTEHDFVGVSLAQFAILLVLDTDGFPVFYQHPSRVTVGADSEVRAIPRHGQIAESGAPSNTVGVVQRQRANTA